MYHMRSKNEQLTHTKRGIHAARPNFKESAKRRSLRYCECTRKADREPVPLQQVWPGLPDWLFWSHTPEIWLFSEAVGSKIFIWLFCNFFVKQIFMEKSCEWCV